MAAASSDYFTHVGQPGTATTLAAPGHVIGGTSITVGSTTNWPTDTGVIFAVDTVTLVNGVEVRDPGSYTEWEGVVTGPTGIGSLVLREGTDQNYPAGSTTRVYIPVASSRENRKVDGMLVAHNQDGTHKSGASYPLATIADFTNSPHDHSSTANGGPVNAKNLNNPYKFSVYRNSSQTPSAGAFTKVGFNTRIFDTGSNFDTTNKRFIAPVNGFYFFTARQSSTNPNTVYLIALYVNGTIHKRGVNTTGTTTQGAEVSGLIQLSATDYVEVFVFATTANALEGTTKEFGTFDGFLVSAT
jgi:hypothetical protein